MSIKEIAEHIRDLTTWAIFEPNDETLWAGVRMEVGRYLHGLWRAGVVSGATENESYYVRCDREVMTQEIIDAGRIVIEVGVAFEKPAEFHVARIIHDANGNGSTVIIDAPA